MSNEKKYKYHIEIQLDICYTNTTYREWAFCALRKAREEKIMTQQDRQIKKVKLFRTLKVVFYCLGLPLFVLAVFMSSVRFIGHDPFTGNTQLSQQLGFFKDINLLFTSPALYGVWIAFGIWAIIAIVHIILSKTVKSRRVRTLSVTAFTLVIMLGGMFVMDAVLSAKIDDISKASPSTVSVADYKTQLSYYRTVSSNRHARNMTENLIEQINLLKKVYNVEMEGANKSGAAGSIGNKPVTYYNVISDDGVSGVDIGFITGENGIAKLNVSGADNNISGGDGNITKDVEGKQVIRLAPNSNGELVINGKVYSHYFAQVRSSVSGQKLYTWYTRDMMSTAWIEGDSLSQITNMGEGHYGKALYSQNGLLSDGWIFSLDNVLEILEDYYEAKEAIDNGDEQFYANAYSEMYSAAVQRRYNYYMGLEPDINGEMCDPWTTALFQQEADINIGRFSLTRGELDELLAKVGALLGRNSLFNYILNPDADELLGDLDGIVNGFIPSLIGGSLKGLFDKLSKGMSLTTLLTAFKADAGLVNTIGDILKMLVGKDKDATYFIDDIYIVLSYVGQKDCFDVKHDNLYLALVRGVASWQYADGTAVPVTRKADGKWYYSDGTEFTTTTDGGTTVDKDGKEVKKVIAAGENPQKDILLDIDFDDRIIGEEEIVDPATGQTTYKYAFDFDTLSTFLNTALNNVIEKYVGNLDSGIVGTIVDLVSKLNLLKSMTFNGENYIGLEISGIQIPIIKVVANDDETTTKVVDIDIVGILTNVVSTLYSYQSAVIKPVWEFFEDPEYVNNGFGDDPAVIAQRNYTKYERALYTATVHGKMIGSILIGDNLGTGAYPSSLGLTDLASVQQLKTNLSYQTEFFPLFALRDMLAIFTGLVIMFYFISFVAAQREEDYASGKLTVRSRKKEKKHEAEVIAEFDALDVENAVEDSGESPEDSVDNANVPLDQPDDALPAEEKPKKRFGKKNKPVEDDDLALTDDDLLAADDVVEEEKPKKKLFGKKNKPAEDDELTHSDEDLLAADDVVGEEKPKKKLFGKKEKPVEEEIDDDDFADTDFDEEEAPKKKGLFGKKKKKGGEDPDLPVDENFDGEVL